MPHTNNKEVQEVWEDEFRKQFDELKLKPPKSSMKNAERELIIWYIRNLLDRYVKSIDELTCEHHQELQKAREEERERIEAIFKEHVPPHAMDLEDSVWLKRLLNKAFNHDKNI